MLVSVWALVREHRRPRGGNRWSWPCWEGARAPGRPDVQGSGIGGPEPGSAALGRRPQRGPRPCGQTRVLLLNPTPPHIRAPSLPASLPASPSPSKFHVTVSVGGPNGDTHNLASEMAEISPPLLSSLLSSGVFWSGPDLMGCDDFSARTPTGWAPSEPPGPACQPRCPAPAIGRPDGDVPVCGHRFSLRRPRAPRYGRDKLGEAGPSQKEGSFLRQAIRAQRAQTAWGEPPAPEGAEREASMGTEGHVQGRRSPRCLRQGRRLPEAGAKLGRCHGFRKQGELCPPPSDPLLRPALAGEGSLPPRPHAAAAGDGQGFH